MSDFDPGPGWRQVAESDIRLGDAVVSYASRDGEDPTWWVREVPVPPLPTEPGYYVAEADAPGAHTVVELLNSPAGQWVDSGDRRYVDPDVVRALGPLVRLEPRAVTAKAVLEALMRGKGIFSERLDDVAREFGAAL